MIKKKEVEVCACDYCGSEDLRCFKIDIMAGGLHILSYHSSIDICFDCIGKIIPKLKKYLKNIGVINHYEIHDSGQEEIIKEKEKALIAELLKDEKL